MSFPHEEVRAAWENFVAVGDSGDWEAWADLHTVDGVWVEHHLGTFQGRDAIKRAIVDVMAMAPKDMCFPVEWVAFDGDRVVYYPWQVLPHPAGGEPFRFGCVTVLTYAGDGQFSSRYHCASESTVSWAFRPLGLGRTHRSAPSNPSGWWPTAMPLAPNACRKAVTTSTATTLGR